MASKSLVRVAGIVLAIGIVGFFGMKLLKKLTRSEANKQLEARQDKARDSVGPGLDDVFSTQLDKDTSVLPLVATLDVDHEHLGDNYKPEDCAKGFSEAFEEVLGADVITVSTSMISSGSLKLAVSGKITASGESFVLPNSRQPYPGIELEGDVSLGGTTAHVKVQPGADIKFEYSRSTSYMIGEDRSITPSEVAAGIFQATCKQAGFALLEKMTSWKRPAPPPPPDPVADCERGFHCVENGDQLAETEPAKAEKLYATACQNDDEKGCARLAALAASLPPHADSALARVTLDMACSQEMATACTGAARVALIPYEAGKPPSEYQKVEALVRALHGCDLGDRDACEVAASAVKGTPYAEAGPVLLGGKPVASKRYGTVFALRWGQWTKMDNGQATIWVTKRPSGLPEGTVVKQFSTGELPQGVVAPPALTSVYAIALRGGHGAYDTECDQCKKGGKTTSIYSMRALDCVCSVIPH